MPPKTRNERYKHTLSVTYIVQLADMTIYYSPSLAYIPLSQVQIVVVAEKVQQYMDESGSNKVLPVCALYRKELRRFIETALPERNPMGPADYLNAFVAAFNKFNTDSTSGNVHIISMYMYIHCTYMYMHVQNVCVCVIKAQTRS